MVINVYIDTKNDEKNKFDHPTDLDNFENENTFSKTLESINELEKTNDDLSLYIFAVAESEVKEQDQKIRKKMKKIMKKSNYDYYLFTNSDIEKIKKYTNSKFISVSGYSEIRNLGLIIPSLLEEDLIIQIDDDELLRKGYLRALKKIINNNPDKYLITAPYEKNGSTDINNEDPLDSWHKFSSMQKDIKRLMKDQSLKETLFGFGGNMIVRKELACKSFYPLGIPRGEDFSYLLANRLIYENGNEKADIKKKDKIYKAYFSPLKDLTIIHEPPFEAKADFIFYLEKNLKRFIMEWSIFINQNKLSISELKELSFYLSAMFGYQDFKIKLMDIIEEVKAKYSSSKKVEKFENEILNYFDKYNKINRFKLYKRNHHEYLKFQEKWQKDRDLKELLLNVGKQ